MAQPASAAPLEHHVPVEHRWLGLDRRTIRPAVGVLVLAAVWAVVAPAVDRIVPEDQRVEAGQVFGAGNGVTVAPPTGWHVEAGIPVSAAPPTQSAPDGVEVTSGGTTVHVITARWGGTLRELLDRGTEILEDSEDGGWHVTGGEGPVRTMVGVTGIAAEWRSSERTGRVVAFLWDGVGVQIVIATSFEERLGHEEEIEAMVASTSFGGNGS
jgi:hypothetical protein